MKIITDKLIGKHVPKLTYTQKVNKSVMITRHVYEVDKNNLGKLSDFLKTYEEMKDE